MSNDLISREALKKAFKVEELYWGKRIIDEINNATTVEGEILTEEAYSDLCLRASRERPQGKWIRTGSLGNGNAHYECSECHYGDEHAENQEVPYCWHCGADMRGEKK